MPTYTAMSNEEYLRSQGKMVVSATGRKQRVYYGRYVVPAAGLAANSTVLLRNLPKGFQPFRGKIITDAFGGTATVAIGDGTTATKYLAAAVKNTANLTTEIDFKGDGRVPISADAGLDVVMTLAAAALTDGMTIDIIIEGFQDMD